MKKVSAFLLMMGLGFLCSCESRDGDWDPMVWEGRDASNVIAVPQAGSTYVLACKNYKSFWVYAIQLNGQQAGGSRLSVDGQEYEDENLSVSVEGNKMSVTVFPNEDRQARNISIGVTAGDIFSSFLFRQAGKGD